MAEAAVEKAAPPATLSPGYRRYALLILVLGYTSSHVDRNIVGILMEPIKADLLLSDTQLGFLSGIAFAVFYATLGIPIALWADRGNRRNIIAWAIAIWSGMTALCGLATNFVQLAAARVGVGIGEAGSSPPSHSMIADMYPPNERASAMAVYSLGVYFGVMIGFLVGGWVAVWYGWRAAFFVVGLPGLILALLVRFTLVEPERGGADGIAPEKHAPLSFRTAANTVKEGFHHLWRTAAARHVVIGVTITSFVGYGGVMWGPAFLIRTHGMSIGEVSTFLALLVGIVGGLGAYIGGRLTDRLAQKDVRWNTWVVAWAKLIVVPFIVAFYLSDNWVAFHVAGYPVSILWVIYVPISFLGAFYLGPSFAMIQTLTPPAKRALASAVMLFIINIIGLGFGPQFVGILSDFFNYSMGMGTQSLRWALFGTALLNVWAAAHYFLAGHQLKKSQSGGHRA
ncbi:major facilitator superfamily MFS_1 [Parvibaculum lavamentivorans DS-1]|uniref:Major facilitator superfamily MFS_1 n=1 Tax=Parvibaculum lavamentivorans (strain DS-1 / DSM 13023 / NCIMB 13966) TaxID=402881 RepID=A7HTW5_PARL1|nr:MFS transporter [Parvibaculum lavamentivorans]ABS63348.1 major facilitator superfamily MFS_1 [Parvibaculum lavamentivorans DS-1]